MAFEALASEYLDRADFVTVYVKEAHSREGWSLLGSANDAEHDVSEHRTLADRVRAARHWIAGVTRDNPALAVSSLFVVDDMDDSARLAFDAWPERLYVVEDGVVSFRGDEG